MADGGCLEGHFLSADDIAGFGTGIGGVDAFSGGAAKVVFGLHVFQVERKAENVLVLHFLLGVGARNRRQARRGGEAGSQPKLQCAATGKVE